MFSAEKLSRNYHAPRPLLVEHGGGLALDPIEWRWGPVDFSILVPWGRDGNRQNPAARGKTTMARVAICSGVRPKARPPETMVLGKAVGFRRRFSPQLKMAEIESKK